MGYIKKCPKCDSVNNFTKVKGTNTGLYCKDCGTWIKWLSKYETKLFETIEHEKSIENRCESKEFGISNNEYFENSIVKLIDFINKEVENEFNKMPISDVDSIRKPSYCMGLDRVRLSLEDILNNYKKE